MGMEKLEYLLAVERTGSISKAAESLYLSQPSLSKSIASLERQIGCRIFERTSTGLKPTPEGKRYLAYAHQVMELREETMKDLRQLMQERSQKAFSLGLSPMRSIETLSRSLLNTFNANLNVLYRAEIAQDEKLEEDVLSGRLDMAIITAPMDGRMDPRLCVRHLTTERLLLAVPDGFLEGRIQESAEREYPYVDPRDLRGQRFILPSEGGRMRGMADVFFQAEGIVPRIFLMEDYIDFALAEADKGLGICFVNERLAGAAHKERLRYCETAGTLPLRTVYAIWRKNEEKDADRISLYRLLCEDWEELEWDLDALPGEN